MSLKFVSEFWVFSCDLYRPPVQNHLESSHAASAKSPEWITHITVIAKVIRA